MMDESGITSQCWSVHEAVPNKHFVSTIALGPGCTPNPEPEGGFQFTDMLEFFSGIERRIDERWINEWHVVSRRGSPRHTSVSQSTCRDGIRSWLGFVT